MISCAALLLIVVAPAAAQRPEPPTAQAVALYRGGDLRGALELLAQEPLDRQERFVRDLVRAGIAAPEQPETPHRTVAFFLAAGTLQMEAALHALHTIPRNARPVVRAHMALGEALLDAAATRLGAESGTKRWFTVIALAAQLLGRFYDARAILETALARYPAHRDLLVAYGSIRETLGSVSGDPSDLLRQVTSSSTVATNKEFTLLATLRQERDEHLRIARSNFEQVLSLDPTDDEAALRLAHVLLRQGSGAQAITLLTPLLERPSLRLAYLSRLLLGHAFEQEGRPGEAAAQFRAAIARLPAQSARVALAATLHATGDKRDGGLLAEQILAARTPQDPWWAYRFGEFWRVEELLPALREEGRR
ncbi:MAG TPA: tetratricopeptide repeat protein [Vicinamibacterales bacterium]|nr:tetratricopeptide repeat protein [Vicinamibacterales bacterium]